MKSRGGDGRELSPTDNQVVEGKYIDGVAADQLRSIVDRVERLENKKRGLSNDIREILKEASHLASNQT